MLLGSVTISNHYIQNRGLGKIICGENPYCFLAIWWKFLSFNLCSARNQNVWQHPHPTTRSCLLRNSFFYGFRWRLFINWVYFCFMSSGQNITLKGQHGNVKRKWPPSLQWHQRLAHGKGNISKLYIVGQIIPCNFFLDYSFMLVVAANCPIKDAKLEQCRISDSRNFPWIWCMAGGWQKK